MNGPGEAVVLEAGPSGLLLTNVVDALERAVTKLETRDFDVFPECEYERDGGLISSGLALATLEGVPATLA